MLGLGFDSYQSVILSAPAFFVSGFSGIILGYFCVYTKNTRVIGTIFTLLVSFLQLTYPGCQLADQGFRLYSRV